MFSNIILSLWTGAGLAWWILALFLTVGDRGKNRSGRDTCARRSLSIFKPLPPLGARGLKTIATGLESFAAQLDGETEMLLGIHEADRDFIAPFLDRLQTRYPKARIKVIFRTEADDMANPKIAWQRILARHADGEWWLWSDADVTAPPGCLQSARREFARSNAAMMTFPYVVRKIFSLPALLEALFVNVEFYPGVLLLRRFGAVDFGLGAAMIFRRDDFLREVDWSEIGAWLADDFFLGQKLGPVEIGTTTLETVPGSWTWKDAFLHDLRWTKTIRWNRPIGSFARILIMPVMGWTGLVVFHPTDFFAWLGLVGMVQADVLFATAICRRAGCPLKLGHLVGMELWSFWRTLLWVLSWVPWPVLWSGKMWRGPRVEMSHEINLRSVTEAVDKTVWKSDLLK